MAISTNQPVERDGQTYDLLGINLAMSPLWKPNGVGVSIACRLVPFRLGEDDVPEHLDDAAQAVVYGDAAQDAAGDPALAEFLRAIEAAGQAFIDAKGL
jgi:hypothetical protein